MRGNLDGLPSSLLISPEYLCHLHQTNFFFSIVCPRTSADVLRMADVWFSDKMPGVELSLQGVLFSFCCRSAWNFAFASSRHKLPTLSFLMVFLFS